jgi:chemotaxis response regulator CheB
MKKITVLLADDHAVVREGLRALLAIEPDVEVVGEAQSGRQAVQMTKKLLPAVVVMDIAMPLLNGLEAARQILKAVPATKVLMLSAHRDDEYVDEVIRPERRAPDQRPPPTFFPRRFGKLRKGKRSSLPRSPSASAIVSKTREAERRDGARRGTCVSARARWRSSSSSPKVRPTSKPRMCSGSASRPSRNIVRIS